MTFFDSIGYGDGLGWGAGIAGFVYGLDGQLKVDFSARATVRPDQQNASIGADTNRIRRQVQSAGEPTLAQREPVAEFVGRGPIVFGSVDLDLDNP